MALTDIVLVSTSGSFQLDTKEVTIEWLVFSDNLNDFTVEIAKQGQVEEMIVDGEAKGWLWPGSPYVLGNDTWPTAYASNVDVSERKIIRGDGQYEIEFADGTVRFAKIAPTGTVRWKVVQKFSTKSSDKGEENPSVDDKITISVSKEFEDVPFERDIRTGKLVLNSAGEFFVPAAVMRKAKRRFAISRRENPNPLIKSDAYENVVNSDNWYGAAPGTLLMESITCDYNGESWENVTYNMIYKADGWQTKILDTGLNERESKDFHALGELVPITLGGSETSVASPAKLDGRGQKLNDQNQDGVDMGPFWKYNEMPFLLLCLPNPYTVVSRS